MTVAEVAALRRHLWGAGFRPVAIYSHDAGVSDAGKRPIGTAWQERARRVPPGAVVERVEAIALNTGILCDGLRAVDIDIDDAWVARRVQDQAQRMLGRAPIRWRSNSPRRLLLYRAAEGEPPKAVCKGSFGKAEVLGRGQQFVAYGLHPSGAPLAWYPADPACVGFDGLTAVSEAEIATFLRAVGPLIGTKPAVPIRPSKPITGNPGAALAGVARVVAGAPIGERNSLAFWGACRAGEMVAKGLIGADAAVAVIVEAAMRAGLSQIEADRTARSGLSRGAGNA